MQHSDFINRIRKTLYYGVGTADTDMKVVSSPLAEYASEIFSEPHRGHSLHRLSCVAAGKIQATPCSLIMALIYLDRLNTIDPGYGCRITPQELFVVSLVSKRLICTYVTLHIYICTLICINMYKCIAAYVCMYVNIST